MVDEYTRECLTIDVARQYRSEHVLDRLAELFVERGAPTYLVAEDRVVVANLVGELGLARHLSPSVSVRIDVALGHPGPPCSAHGFEEL
jgi:hypothetical protein